MVMVPDDWQSFIANTTRQVEDGQIPISRIDDAVSRIVRAKLRMDLFGKRPSQRQGAGDATALQHRELARRAVRESLVLLKNNLRALPLRAGAKILVVGKSADSLPNQAGSWSLSRSEEHTSELQSLMRSSYAVFCLKKKTTTYSKIT